MKRSYIWLICTAIGLSFLTLLYLQSRYAEIIVKMRKQQFDENVFRSLDQASRELEKAETFRYLQDVLSLHTPNSPLIPGTLNPDVIMDMQNNRLQGDVQDSLTEGMDSLMQSVRNVPVHFPKSRTMPKSNHMEQTISRMQQHVRRAYAYEHDVLEEVVYAVMYQAGKLRLEERLDFAMLDNCLHTALERNGVTMPFHFIVYTSDGREIFRCLDYEPKGQEYSYTQTLFRSDPSGQMGVVSLHFPDQQQYVLSTANFVAPAMIFTFILFGVFMITIYLVVHQKKVSEMKNDFVHNMTHEFKTPISTISIAAQMLSDNSVPKSSSTYERLSNIITTETKRLRFQVDKVLQMSLFENNNIALKLTELDATYLIDNVVEIFSLKVSQNGGALHTKLLAENPFVNVDEMHFTNVIYNLMDNAIKYRRQDVPLQLDIATWNKGDTLCISIQDNGIGMQKDQLKKIFEKFYRVHTGNQHDVKGFGLGLAYVRKMVELHHGTIKVTSEIGQGTKFVITLKNTIN